MFADDGVSEMSSIAMETSTGKPNGNNNGTNSVSFILPELTNSPLDSPAVRSLASVNAGGVGGGTIALRNSHQGGTTSAKGGLGEGGGRKKNSGSVQPAFSICDFTLDKNMFLSLLQKNELMLSLFDEQLRERLVQSYGKT